jgi:hypothetical protein
MTLDLGRVLRKGVTGRKRGVALSLYAFVPAHCYVYEYTKSALTDDSLELHFRTIVRSARK